MERITKLAMIREVADDLKYLLAFYVRGDDRHDEVKQLYQPSFDFLKALYEEEMAK